MAALEDMKRLMDGVDFGLREIGFLALAIVLAKIVGRRTSANLRGGFGDRGDWGGGGDPD